MTLNERECWVGCHLFDGSNFHFPSIAIFNLFGYPTAPRVLGSNLELVKSQAKTRRIITFEFIYSWEHMGSDEKADPDHAAVRFDRPPHREKSPLLSFINSCLMRLPKSAVTYALVPTMASYTVYWRSAYLLHTYVCTWIQRNQMMGSNVRTTTLHVHAIRKQLHHLFHHW